MSKFQVVYWDGGRMVNAGSAEELPEGYEETEEGSGVFEGEGAAADGAAVFIRVGGETYVPDDDYDD